MPAMTQDLVDLARKLIALDTINPPGQESEAVMFCASWLKNIGFDCTVHSHSPTRASLIATRERGSGLPLCFSGHLDTVPLGNAPWTRPPFDGLTEGDWLFGRGSSDMKGGVAAFLLACREVTSVKGGVTIILTAGEETGCDGARWLAEAGVLPAAGAMIVGESTDNRPLAGHKGAYWLKLVTHGKTAHGATPDRGVNAILKATPLLSRLTGLDLGVSHPVMGRATWNLGTIHAGLNTNSVPDRCEMTLDLRSVDGITHAEIRDKMGALAGPDIDIETLLDLPAVWTDPDEPWFAQSAGTIARITGVASEPAVASYFTDASILKPAMQDLPVMILGPGSVDQPHSTDEHIRISRMIEAVELYSALLREWDGRKIA
ncbi:M20 family metallopeptidase [Pseudochelatococcus sp. B33]